MASGGLLSDVVGQGAWWDRCGVIASLASQESLGARVTELGIEAGDRVPASRLLPENSLDLDLR